MRLFLYFCFETRILKEQGVPQPDCFRLFADVLQKRWSYSHENNCVGVQTIAPEEHWPPRLGLGFGLGLALELGLGQFFSSAIVLEPLNSYEQSGEIIDLVKYVKSKRTKFAKRFHLIPLVFLQIFFFCLLYVVVAVVVVVVSIKKIYSDTHSTMRMGEW